MGKVIQDMEVKGIFCFMILAWVLNCASGCAVMTSKEIIYKPFNEAQIKEIRKGITKKSEILDWFGPPVSIARKGAIMPVPSPEPEEEGSIEIASETFFDLFSSKHQMTENHIIYYYYSYGKSGLTISPLYILSTGTISSDINKLWILINEKTGTAEDYIYRSK